MYIETPGHSSVVIKIVNWGFAFDISNDYTILSVVSYTSAQCHAKSHIKQVFKCCHRVDFICVKAKPIPNHNQWLMARTSS